MKKLIIILIFLAILIPIVGATTTTIYPEVDGYVGTDTANVSFATINTANGGAADNISESMFTLLTNYGGTPSPNFDVMQGTILSFDTSSIPDDANITGVTLNITKMSSAIEHGDWSVAITNGTLGTNTALVPADYQRKGTLELATRKAVSTISTGNTTFTFNDNGKDWASKTSYTVIFVRLADSVDGSFSGEWGNDRSSNVRWYSNDNTTTGNRPYLTITYDLPPTPTGFTTAYPLSLINETRISPISDTNLPLSGLTVSINGTPGEYESSSFIIKPNQTTTDYTISATILSDADGTGHTAIPTNATDISIIKVWYQRSESDIYIGAGGNPIGYFLAPELLLKNDSLIRVNYTAQTNEIWVQNDTFSGYVHVDNTTIGGWINDWKIYDNATAEGFPQNFTLPANENKQIWMTTHIPSGQTAGNYTGKIWVNSSTMTPIAINLTIRILPFTLPNATLDYGLYYRGTLPISTALAVPEYKIDYLKKSEAQYTKDIDDMKNHGVSYPSLMTKWFDDAPYKERYEKELEIRQSSGLPQDMLFANPIDNIAEMQDPEAGIFGTRIPQLITAATTYGFGTVYSYGEDEANDATTLSERPGFTAMQNNGSKVWVATFQTYDTDGVAGDLIDTVVVNGNEYGTGFNTTFLNEWKAISPTKKVYIYANQQAGVENPELYRYGFGLPLWISGYDGAINFAYQQTYPSNVNGSEINGYTMWNDFDSDSSNYRDEIFVYQKTDGVIDTIQWEGWREGIDDTRYADTLSSITGNTTEADTIIDDGLAAGQDMSVIRNHLIDHILAYGEGSGVAPIANFTCTPLTGTSPTSVTCTDSSIYSPTSWSWAYKNATVGWTAFNTSQNPIISLPVGTYDINLTATNDIGSDDEVKTGYITVSAAPTPSTHPIANFSANITSGAASLPVLFTDSSVTSIRGWSWYFGDEPYTQSWTTVNSSAFTARYYHAVFSNPNTGNIVVAGGQTTGSWNQVNDTWRSPDNGTTWAQVNTAPGWSKRAGMGYTTLSNGHMILMGGAWEITSPTVVYQNDVWRSTDDGSTWELMNASPGWDGRTGMVAVRLQNDTILMMGGKNATGDALSTNQVWKSADEGATWSFVGTAGWGGRNVPFAVVLPDNVVVVGNGDKGAGSSNVYTDVWNSTDGGATWTQINASVTAWDNKDARAYAVMPDGTIVLAAGVIEAAPWTRLQEVWKSKDGGATWTQLADGSFSGSSMSAATVAANGSFLLTGGSADDSTPFDDVWAFNPAGSNLQNPTHTYTASGNYTVSLQVTNSTGFNATQKISYINVSEATIPTPPVASFSANISTGSSPLPVQFTDTSVTSITVWDWMARNTSPGNDSVFSFSAIQHPIHTFTNGNWLISLNVTNASGYDVATNYLWINVSEAGAIIPAFSCMPTTLNVTEMTTCVDSSGGTPDTIDEIYWTFEDSTTEIKTGTTSNHTYISTGAWNVTLSAFNSTLGFVNLTKVDYITANLPTNSSVTAAFSCSPLTLNLSQTLSCVDSSTSVNATITNWSWTFEDTPTQYAATQNAAIVYSALGIWDVTLGVYNATTGWNNLTKPNYVTVSNSSYNGFNRQDILMDQIYTLTLNVKEDSTHNGIEGATVQLSNGDNSTTDVFGQAVFTLNYTALAVQVGATGYTSRTISYIIDRDRTETIYLTASPASTTTNTTTGTITYYTPWQVRIRIADFYGNPLPGTNVTASYIASTLPNTNTTWLVSAYGVPASVAEQMTNSSVAMIGNTDSNGGLSFSMFKSIQYSLLITNTTAGISATRNLYPSDQEYLIRVPLPGQVAVNNSLTAMANTSLPIYQLNATAYNLSVIYHDSSGLTTDVLFWVKYRNGTVLYNVDLGNPGTGVVAANYTINDLPMGTELMWSYNARRST